MTKFFITDIHGDYKGLKLLLNHGEIDWKKDQLVIGGDMINRGKDSAGVVKEIKALKDKNPDNVHCLIGNHEEMMRDYFLAGDKTWLSHGGHDTLQQFNKIFSDEKERQEHIEWATSLPLYVEDDEFVYTHAGLYPNDPLDKQDREILWMPESDFYAISKDALFALTNGKPVVHGHTPVERIYYDGVRLNCDLGSNTYTVQEERGLGLVNLNEMHYFVYKPAQKKIVKHQINRY